MRKHGHSILLALCAVLLLSLSVPGAYALWQYAERPVEPKDESFSAALSVWEYPKYTITYVNDGEVLDKVMVWDNSADVSTANASAEQKVETAMGGSYDFSHWMNAGSTRVDKILAGNTEDITLFPSFVNRYTAMFVDQDGNILAWDTYTKNSYNNIKTLGNNTQPPAVKDCIFDYWEIHITDNTGKTVKTEKLADYKFNDATDITIYPIYTYNGDVNLIPVDIDGDGITDEYYVGGYSNPNGQNLVHIPDYVNGRPITAINANAFSSYDGVHSVVIPNTVMTVGKNILATDWSGILNKGETVTIYFEGTYEQWVAKEASFPSGWDNGLSGSSRVFFLDANGKVDPNQGYMQGELKTNFLGTGTALDWKKSTVTAALKNEYDGPCDCKACDGADRPDRHFWTDVVIP